MRVAPGDLNLALPPRKHGRVPVCGGKHLPVAGLNSGEIVGEPFEIVSVSLSGHGRKYVVYREKQALLGQDSRAGGSGRYAGG